MVQILSLHKNVSNAEETFLEFRVVKAARQFVKLYRKIGVLHLAREGILEAALKCGRTIDVELRAGQKCRSEKRKSLDVIPVCVPDEEMNAMRPGAAHHV